MQFGCTRDWDNPRLLGQQPRETDLSGCSPFALCEVPDQIDQYLIGFPVFRREARNQITEVVFLKLGVLADFASQETSPQGAKRNQTDSELLESRHYIQLGLSPPE